MRIFSDIIEGIKNLWKWLPIVWKDRNWDQYYLYELLHFKLQNMERLHRNYSYSLYADRTADQLKVCKLLLDRLIKDEYYENTFRNHDKKWGRPKIRYEPVGDRYKKLVMYRKNVTEENEEQERKEFLRLCEHEHMLRKQDIEYLFKLMTKHIGRWWD